MTSSLGRNENGVIESQVLFLLFKRKYIEVGSFHFSFFLPPSLPPSPDTVNRYGLYCGDWLNGTPLGVSPCGTSGV